MPTRFLVAPDKFKGSLSAGEAADAIAEGIRRVFPDAEIDLCPIADGGEGFMESLAAALNAEWVSCPAVDALDRPIDSRYAISGKTAILEMAETSGLWRISADERSPLDATTKGTGMQILDAIVRHGVDKVILGIGGSATNDGGCGMARALGVSFQDQEGNELEPTPRNLERVTKISMEGCIALPEIVAACDVENPLLGKKGATAVFSAQKGAGPEDQVMLENALGRVVELSKGELAAEIPGAGAAGGLGFGLLHFAGAGLESGFDLIADLLGLKKRIAAADHVVTGEGALDHQSLAGKGPVALARMARDLSVPVTGFCGITDEAARASGLFTEIHSLADSGLPLEVLIANAGPMLTSMTAAAHTRHFIKS